MNVHLLDGTYELFRHFYAVDSVLDENGREVGALLGVMGSVLGMLEGGATHIGVATDHVIESFRNGMWSGYKTSAGVDPTLLSQFHPLEDALAMMGVVVWPMVEHEADDALASAAARAAADQSVSRVFVCTPDKDLGQCVVGERVVQLDRRTRTVRDAAFIAAKFGVSPASIPDFLALVGDSADGYPGLPGWGEKSSGIVLARYRHLETIPGDGAAWEVAVRGAGRLAAALAAHWDLALLFRDLATLRTDAAVFETVEELRWTGPQAGFDSLCARLRAPRILARATALAELRRPAGPA